MKKFAGNKPLIEIKRQCEAAGIDYNDTLYRRGGDYVVITTVNGDNDSGQVLYNTVNGKFFGTTPDGIQFDSSSTKHENEPWFQALLSFFYVVKAAA
ncbi:hypothetical protein CURE108131_23050 [Cupriavidus respiraculi]|uniref:Uncharacterized protein n=1 Tax=Cupriavidus respiraculi TaxID=195930 RepID=A0ABN7YJE5_9BURK|nr:hypothetical protein [Cupriavidus respiraculi]CAG9172471.1 hypothetical protein LMG21510_01985 [Cupriavidus respiraculi]